ncbi:MAG: alpha/beta fold hydrolase, partial [Pseudomonadota bacterium]|nr:alpha/beta fold hydrolase [Pseudomonadota bacterium]
RVIILIHGLASSPEAWVNLTNDIFGDPVLRKGYQVWQVFYPTNMPMLESRLKIHQLIERAYQQVDPAQQHHASHHSVLIGHSMGSVIGRMLVSPTDLSDTALTQFNPQERQKLLNVPEVRHYFTLSPLPQVQRAVFISAPFRGTDYADRWFTRALREIIRLPLSFVEAIDDAVARARIDDQLLQRITEAGLLDFQNGASELSRQSRFMQITAPVSIRHGLPYHSIMGQIDPNTRREDASDGIVPYQSSHLAGAASETLIQGGHSIQSTPEAVLELRRILRLHLAQIGDIQNQAQSPQRP